MSTNDDIRRALLNEDIAQYPDFVNAVRRVLDENEKNVCSSGVNVVAWIYEWKPFTNNNPWQTDVSLNDPRVSAVRDIRNLRALVEAPVPAASEDDSDWRPIRTAPRDGTWFIARTASGYERKVHYADSADRLPYDHTREAWSTIPVEWRPIVHKDEGV